MSGRRLVYAFVTGAYSDYGVEALFETRELAQMAVDVTSESHSYSPRIEEMWLYDEFPERIESWTMTVEVWDDGQVDEVLTRNESAYPWEHLWGIPPERPRVRYVRAPIHHDRGGRIEVYGQDRVGVQKALNDFRARVIALGGKTIAPKQGGVTFDYPDFDTPSDKEET